MLDAMPPPVRRPVLFHLVPIAILILLAGAVNVYLGKDYSWDLRNYHFYNAWSFLKHRIDIDVLPANLQGFHNPLIELPFYFLAAKGVNDFVIAYAMVLPTAVSMYVAWLITGVVSRTVAAPRSPAIFALRAVTVVATATGGAGWCQWGTTSGEWPTACLPLIALFLALTSTPQTKRQTAIGPLLGLACGLKLTAIPFASGVALAYIYLLLSTNSEGKWRQMLIMAAGGLLTFVATLAPWGWVLWDHYRNPLFPYFNGIFKSDVIEKTNWRDARFLPDGIIEWLKIPFDLALHREAKYGDSPVRDPRSLVAWLILLLCIIAARYWPLFKNRVATRPFIALAIVFASNFVLWAVAFAIYRYAIGIEMIASLLMFAFIAPFIAQSSGLKPWLSLLLYLPLLATSVDSLGRARFNGGRYFQEQLPPMPRGSLVVNLVATDPPLGYLSPLLGRHITVVKPLSNLSRPGWNNAFQDRIHEIIAHNTGHVFVILKPPMHARERTYLADAGLVPIDAPCATIGGPAYSLPGYVCEFRRTRP